MRATFVFLLILLFLGWLTGDRYGMPIAVTNVTDKGFEKIEAYLPGGGAAGEVAEDAAADRDASDAAPAPSGSAQPAAPASSDLGNPM
ncbi:MAG: hypothetical protein AAGC77_14455, partial [Pseudomonadota bacterium]